MLGNVLSNAAGAFRNADWIAPGNGRGEAQRAHGHHGAQATEGRERSSEADRSGHSEHLERRANVDTTLYGRNGTMIQAGAQAVSMNRSDTLDFQITTAEGDVVTVTMAHAQSQSQAGAYVKTADGSAMAATQSSAESLGIQISVQGDLSAEETQAIKTLMQKAGDVAGAFYSGNMSAATSSAAQMNLQGSTGPIDSFSLSLHSEVERKAAIAMYQGIA
jgi:hypothetical protein